MDRVVHALRAIGILWWREVLRYGRDRARIISSLGPPFFFLFIFGGGLSPVMGRCGAGEATVSYSQFLFPGTVAMAVLFTALFAGSSIVWDREFGFLREVLVAPVGRSAVTLGKILGGTTVATLQGAAMLAFAPLVGVPLTPRLILLAVPLLLLTAFAMTALGVAVAVHMRYLEGFQMLMGLLNVPLLFLSGAFFPVGDLPAWLAALVRLNPLSYAVDALRRVALQPLDPGGQAMALGGPGIEIFGRTLSTWDEVLVVALFGAMATAIGAWSFGRER